MKLFWRILLFVCCLISLVLSLYIFYQQGIVADELNLGAAQLFGGETSLILCWLRILLLLIAATLSFINLFPLKKST